MKYLKKLLKPLIFIWICFLAYSFYLEKDFGKYLLLIVEICLIKVSEFNYLKSKNLTENGIIIQSKIIDIDNYRSIDGGSYNSLIVEYQDPYTNEKTQKTIDLILDLYKKGEDLQLKYFKKNEEVIIEINEASSIWKLTSVMIFVCILCGFSISAQVNLTLVIENLSNIFGFK